MPLEPESQLLGPKPVVNAPPLAQEEQPPCQHVSGSSKSPVTLPMCSACPSCSHHLCLLAPLSGEGGRFWSTSRSGGILPEIWEWPWPHPAFLQALLSQGIEEGCSGVGSPTPQPVLDTWQASSPNGEGLPASPPPPLGSHTTTSLKGEPPGGSSDVGAQGRGSGQGCGLQGGPEGPTVVFCLWWTRAEAGAGVSPPGLGASETFVPGQRRRGCNL